MSRAVMVLELASTATEALTACPFLLVALMVTVAVVRSSVCSKLVSWSALANSGGSAANRSECRPESIQSQTTARQKDCPTQAAVVVWYAYR